MARNIKELLKQIEEKNIILKSLNRSNKPNEERIKNVNTELDSLLYLYLKSLRLGNSGTLTC